MWIVCRLRLCISTHDRRRDKLPISYPGNQFYYFLRLFIHARLGCGPYLLSRSFVYPRLSCCSDLFAIKCLLVRARPARARFSRRPYLAVKYRALVGRCPVATRLGYRSSLAIKYRALVGNALALLVYLAYRATGSGDGARACAHRHRTHKRFGRCRTGWFHRRVWLRLR